MIDINNLSRYIFVFSAIAVSLVFTEARADWFKSQQNIMGVPVIVDIWHQDASLARQCSENVFAEMRRIDALMSSYKANSEVTEINRYAAENSVNISDELFNLIKFSQRMAEKSGGAFDITFASVGYLYDYRNRKKPTDKTIQDKLKFIDYRNIDLNDKNRSIKFTRKGMRIDLGGIAKGYAVDKSIAILQACGVNNGLVSAGGDARILGDRQGRPWMMGVRHPRSKNDIVVSLPLTNTAISTSGDYERFFIADGKRYHHIIRPATGTSVATTWSVTVLADNSMLADALSTSLFVLGEQEGLKLIDEYINVDAIIIDSRGKMFYSSGLAVPN
jgi:thiamine biosynthesis lipoprotein